MRLAVIALAGAVHAQSDRYGDVDFSSSGYGNNNDGYGASGALGGGFGGEDEGFASSFGSFDDGLGPSSGYRPSAGRSTGRSAGIDYGTSRSSVEDFGNQQLSNGYGSQESDDGPSDGGYEDTA